MINTVKVICVSEPDISYTRNKKIERGQTYDGRYIISDLGHYGKVNLYEIFDVNGNRMGEYYAKDFQTVEEHRNKKLEDILC